MKKSAVMVACAFALGSAVSAFGAAPWRVFASSSDRGEYGTYASANASVQSPNALGLRATGRSSKPFEVSWTLSCDGVAQARSGQVVVASVAASAKCTVYGSASGGPGAVRLDLLRR